MEGDYIMGVDWGRTIDIPFLANMSSDTCAVFYDKNGDVDMDRFTRDQLKANVNVETPGSFAAKLNFGGH